MRARILTIGCWLIILTEGLTYPWAPLEAKYTHAFMVEVGIFGLYFVRQTRLMALAEARRNNDERAIQSYSRGRWNRPMHPGVVLGLVKVRDHWRDILLIAAAAIVLSFSIYLLFFRY